MSATSALSADTSTTTTSTPAPRILVFGTGSIGGFYACLLSKATPSPVIVTVCRSNYDAVLRDGITVQSDVYGGNLYAKPLVVQSVEEGVSAIQSLGDLQSSTMPVTFDYVFVCIKNRASTTNLTPSLIAPAVTNTKTTIVLIANGIGFEKPYHKIFPNNTIISGVTYTAATQTSPGIIKHIYIELLHIGTYPADSPPIHKERAQQLGSILKSSGSNIQIHEDIRFEVWSKLVINAPWNPICTLSKSRNYGFLHSSPLATDFVYDAMMEVALIAQAEGYAQINTELVQAQLNRAVTLPPPGIEPSMMADALAGKRLEVDTLVGNVLELAKKNGINTPILRSIYILIKALDESIAAKLGE